MGEIGKLGSDDGMIVSWDEIGMLVIEVMRWKGVDVDGWVWVYNSRISFLRVVNISELVSYMLIMLTRFICRCWC